ncbi:hypothetical protein LWI29_024113 [Acer saccharum]|uniref:Uncharacterized protein n=1 Tax=Acer saccharum TaxID=4024 RepID=A0AA39SWW2_ACESA|nr:hypothetical protein LWI29_024113 [Acer saccharum]
MEAEPVVGDEEEVVDRKIPILLVSATAVMYDGQRRSTTMEADLDVGDEGKVDGRLFLIQMVWSMLVNCNGRRWRVVTASGHVVVGGAVVGVLILSYYGHSKCIWGCLDVADCFVYQSQQVGRSEDSLIGVHVHSSRVGAVPVSSEGPSSILDVSAGAVVSISSAVLMVGQGSKVGRDSVSPLVSFAQPIVSSVVSVDELDNMVGS